MRTGHGTEAPALNVELEAELLSRREIEVLRLLAAGFSNHEIADRLMIAESTVKMHLKHLYGKLDVHNRVQAVVQAQAMQLLI
jgi:ATP/maltotriose-dependent transcriptional regulator MalT